MKREMVVWGFAWARLEIWGLLEFLEREAMLDGVRVIDGWIAVDVIVEMFVEEDWVAVVDATRTLVKRESCATILGQ